ncbi:uncharacterized protein [Anabrus simplex]|uniref:uncharacterized protein n=1 Tax=Anabrus simplex TaxID=316456 RepID=UPI0034DDB744
MDLETKIKEEPAWLEGTGNASLHSEDIKKEIFIEQHTVGQLVPYIKEETKSSPELSNANHPPPESGRHLKRIKGDIPITCNHCGKLFRNRRVGLDKPIRALRCVQ